MFSASFVFHHRRVKTNKALYISTSDCAEIFYWILQCTCLENLYLLANILFVYLGEILIQKTSFIDVTTHAAIIHGWSVACQ